MDDEFYKDKYFDEIMRQMADMQADIKDIKSKVIYMYGAVAGISLFASFVIEYFRTKIFGH